MPNPRYLSIHGEPTVELLQKLLRAKQVFYGNLEWFCEKNAFDAKELGDIQGVYLIGSHAKDEGWHDQQSDLDLKLINPSALPADLLEYKRKVLDKLLHEGEKYRWIDLFFVRELYQVTDPKWDLTRYWNEQLFR